MKIGWRSSVIGSGIYVVMATFLEIEWLRHKAQNALVGADRRAARSRAACFFYRIFLAIERNGQTLNAINGGNEWPANS